MARKWRPSATQRREFKKRMQDPEERAAYEARKEERMIKRSTQSRFDYATAGGYYIPSKTQCDAALNFLHSKELTLEQRNACEIVISGHNCQMKVSHDHIHIVNELSRKSGTGN